MTLEKGPYTYKLLHSQNLWKPQIEAVFLYCH